ncbi:hypothetical protein C8J57DRAFT_1600598 [Mycena rebaudengoi]|nr:hypothetical protein C8J57DRAFT_1600598 [Mycena rebaudengoi]
MALKKRTSISSAGLSFRTDGKWDEERFLRDQTAGNSHTALEIFEATRQEIQNTVLSSSYGQLAVNDMDEALNAHPDVAQNLLKLFSDALTKSQGKVKELELSLSEKALAELQVLYAAEKESGLELLSALEECVLDLNSKEADVKEQLHLVAQERESFARQKEAGISAASTLSSEGVAKERAVQLLHEKYDAAIGENIALQKSLETTASDLAAQEAALSQVLNEKILFAQKLLKAQADAQTTESLRSEVAQELEHQRALKQELEIACIQALQENKSQLVSQTTLFTQVVADNDLRFRALQMVLPTLMGIVPSANEAYITEAAKHQSVAATGEQGHAKVVPEAARCRANQTRLEEVLLLRYHVRFDSDFIIVPELAAIRDADKTQILALEDALKTRDVEFEELRNKYEQAKLAAMDMANTSGAEKAQMMALQDVLKTRDGELVELRKQMKSNAIDLKTASKPDTSIWLLTFQQALKARDVELMGLQNENGQLKSAAVDLEEKLLSAGESHKAQIGKLKDILRETDVELMDLQNKNEHIKSTVKSLQNKLLAAETSRHKQAEAATRSAELTRQLKEDLQREKSARVALLDQLDIEREEYRRISQDYDILDVQAQEHETTNENLRRMNHTLKESALRAEIQGEEREATIENLQRTNKNMMCSVLQAGTQIKDELKQAADEERRASEEKLTSALRANAMLQTAYSSLHNAHYQLVKERGTGALEPSVNQTGIPAPAFPQAQSAAGQFESHPDRQYEQRVGTYPSQPSVQSQRGANDRLSSDADQAPDHAAPRTLNSSPELSAKGTEKVQSLGKYLNVGRPNCQRLNLTQAIYGEHLAGITSSLDLPRRHSVSLRRRYLVATVENHGMKRKASTAYLSACGGSAKMQKTQ